MNTALKFLACAAVLLPASLFAQAPAQSPAPPAHQVGLIDMAYVFKNSHHFLVLTEGLQADIEKTDGEAKVMVEKIRQLQGQLTSGALQNGSPDYIKVEEQIVHAKAELETFKRVSQQSFMRKEADIYKTIYLEVEGAVKRYAEYYKYTLVLRFDRNEIDADDNPRDVMNGMNRQIVHHRTRDDMTEPVLKFLNNEWKKSGGAMPTGTMSTPGASSGN
ncbi:OmpH family outer membrane protein [Planctomicrobium sp. SH661]|uniref:OmpH family outer membrane protein n=1 Tax=Planctomicrobium sp. SH661 TaxID=3448124 RepID=UPI003F5B2692